jgi:hypothetical protein
VIFLSTHHDRSVTIGDGVEALLRYHGTQRIDFLSTNDLGPATLPTGPYVSYQKRLWQPWRVYHDRQSAFMVGLEPELAHESKHVAHSLSQVPNAEIVVSSRLYAKKTPDRPLSGLRVAVKDAFDIKGVKTSLSDKAYHHLYPESSKTASAISDLVKRGAIVVGKTRLTSLISKEDPTEAVDYSAPFNARGDGYQSPAAIGSYSWLDVAIGTDSEYQVSATIIVNSDVRDSKRKRQDTRNCQWLLWSAHHSRACRD